MSLFLTSYESVTGLPEIAGYIFVFLFGAVVGSFLNVVIHRVPNRQSIVFPNSSCPKCGNAIKAYDNIPILSWLILGGNCRNCKEKISFRYPAVELLHALLWLLVFWQIGFAPFLPVALFFTSAILALMFIDAEHMILPDLITYPLIILAFSVRLIYPIVFSGFSFSDMEFYPLTAMSGQPEWLVSVVGAVLGALAGGGSLWLIGEIWKRLRGVDAMGLGDVKMMLGVGALLGWRQTILSIFLAAFAGALIGIVLIAKDRDKGLQAQIPFGIFLGIGSIAALLFGERMIGWYVDRFAL